MAVLLLTCLLYTSVSDTTQILGGWLKTNTVTADKLAIGDFTNLATVDEMCIRDRV